MIHIIVIAAIFLILSFLFHKEEYAIILHDNNTASRAIVEFLQTNINTTIALNSILICLVITLFMHSKLKYLGYIIATLIFELGVDLTINNLALEEITQFYVIGIHHTLPIEIKEQFFNLELTRLYSESSVLPRYTPEELSRVASYIEESHNATNLQPLNTKGISNYAKNLFHVAQDTAPQPHFGIFVAATLATVVISIILLIIRNSTQ